VKYLLDTNTCVQFLRHGSNSPVAGKLAAANPGDVALCSVVLGELLFGALRSTDPANSTAQVQTFAGGFPSLPLDDGAAAEDARIRADLAAIGTPTGPMDSRWSRTIPRSSNALSDLFWRIGRFDVCPWFLIGLPA
jgi:tRNA(fMet)-specific endonuclease VapC